MQGALQVSAARVPLRRACVAENRRRGRDASPSSSWPTPASSTTTATSTCSPSTPRPAPDDMLIRITVANRGPEAAPLHLLPTLWFRNTWSWGRSGEGYWPQAAHRAGRRRDVVAPSTPRSGASASQPSRGPAAGADAAVHRERDERRSASSASPNAAPLREGRLPRLRRSTGAHDAVNPRAIGHEGGRPLRARRSRPGGDGACCACACRAEADAARAASAPSFERRLRRSASREADALLRRAHARRRSPPSERRVVAPGATPACSGRSSSTTTSSTHWLEGDPAQPPPPAEPPARPQPRLARTSTTATSSRCRTSGSTRGTPPGIWRST